MNPTVEKFEKLFESEITDLLVLIKDSVTGAAVDGDMLRPSVGFIASVNMNTGAFSRETGRLEWLVPNSKHRLDWKYNFKQYQICHIRARKNIPVPLKPYMLKSMNNCYMIVEVVEKNASEPRLDALREHVMQPVLIEDADLGTFTLNRSYSWFGGNINWNGTACTVYLETDEQDGETAAKALAHLRNFCKDPAEQDRKFRQFATDKLCGLANEWYESEDDDEEEIDEDADVIYITKEEFSRRISLQSITVYPSGNLTLYYDADDMFTDHAIEIDTNVDGEMRSATIVG